MPCFLTRAQRYRPTRRPGNEAQPIGYGIADRRFAYANHALVAVDLLCVADYLARCPARTKGLPENFLDAPPEPGEQLPADDQIHF